MAEYKLKGKSLSLGSFKGFSAYINVGENNTLEGEILNKGQQVPNQRIFGYVDVNSERTLVVFLRTNENPKLHDSLYVALKSGSDLTGRYGTNWLAVAKPLREIMLQRSNLEELVEFLLSPDRSIKEGTKVDKNALDVEQAKVLLAGAARKTGCYGEAILTLS